MMTRDFGSADREVLRELYSKAERTLDDLPYTHEFETIFDKFIAATGRSDVTRHAVWKALTTLRKRSELVRKQR
jgi:hypothetical protein